MKLLPTILQSVADRQVLSINYFSLYQQEKISRLIEPLRLFLESNHWHMIVYCRLRDAHKDFRINRIASLDVSDEYFENQHSSLPTYLDSLSKKENLVKSIIQTSKESSRYIEQDKLYYGWVMKKEIGEELEMTFLTQSIEDFARWMMMFGDWAFILEPPELEKRVKDFARATLSLYQ